MLVFVSFKIHTGLKTGYLFAISTTISNIVLHAADRSGLVTDLQKAAVNVLAGKQGITF